MNHGPQEMYYPSHMSTGQPPPPQTVTSGGMGHYPQQHQQPPLLQPGPAQYSQAPGQYTQYGYQNGLTSPQSTGHQVQGSMGQQGNGLPLPAMSSVQPMSGPSYGGGAQPGFDMTGQVAPPGMKPRVTATLWEDEGSLCFQVEAKGVCVARREDNHMINGTKLLNVAGMTRGRRDGILKSEKLRHVVKIGPMHLKGVWIPFERALDFANKEKITELLYPLFVHNIGALLYHPTNQTRTNAVMAAAERRKQEQHQVRNTQAPGLPSLHQHHHHSMSSSVGGPLPGPQHSIAPHPSQGRPSLDRAHTFPTPPTSASSVMGNMGSQDGSFNWGPPGSMNNVQGTNPLSIDTGLSNARSMPTTPATTPPGATIQSMQQYQQAPQQPYDTSRHMYSAPPPQQNAYPQTAPDQQRIQYSQPTSYIKNEMGPPTARAPGSEGEHHDPKDNNGMIHHGQAQGQVVHSQAEEEAEHEHEAEYTHGNNANYDSNRGSYSYTNGTPVGALPGDHAHLSPDMTGSPSHPASGRATPRTASAPQPYYTQQQGYNTPPRVQPPSSNLYNVMSSERGTANGTTDGNVYAPQPDMSNSIPNGYPAQQQQPVINGVPASNKRGRDDEDDRPSSRGPSGDIDLKRRKTIREGSVSGPPSYEAAPLNRARATITQRRR
ncbi:probable ascospore maturation 1 protein (Asm-1) [Rhynchosporium agropyri]|uniref:Probable ascospore maturation 1 protein (Asm-1) n=1 Tax=Rhynchosporium agropyri TaxID=914238 RepID=A0A1E1KUL6_9HELO|nr:probable ascospore maturation 1 protein (Asm-1) [Rhynchosporium agropyri]